MSGKNKGGLKNGRASKADLIYEINKTYQGEISPDVMEDLISKKKSLRDPQKEYLKKLAAYKRSLQKSLTKVKTLSEMNFITN